MVVGDVTVGLLRGSLSVIGIARPFSRFVDEKLEPAGGLVWPFIGACSLNLRKSLSPFLYSVRATNRTLIIQHTEDPLFLLRPPSESLVAVPRHYEVGLKERWK